MIDIGKGPDGRILHIEISEGGQSIWFAGYCRYWVDEETPAVGGFGCIVHPDPPVSYQWDGERFVRTNEEPPETVEILYGEWLTDEEWRTYCERTR